MRRQSGRSAWKARYLFITSRVSTKTTETDIQHCSIAGLIRIDQKLTFIWLGSPSDDLSGFNRSVLTNIELTPTRTIMNMTAGPIDLSVTFFSPIEVRGAYRQMQRHAQKRHSYSQLIQFFNRFPCRTYRLKRPRTMDNHTRSRYTRTSREVQSYLSYQWLRATLKRPLLRVQNGCPAISVT